MTTITCLLATVLAVLSIPFVLLLWASESRPQRIRRWRAAGWTWQRIATHYGCSQSTARRWAA
jgi:ABC-type spermidine/putrescine transport system permease subunit II